MTFKNITITTTNYACCTAPSYILVCNTSATSVLCALTVLPCEDATSGHIALGGEKIAGCAHIPQPSFVELSQALGTGARVQVTITYDLTTHCITRVTWMTV